MRKRIEDIVIGDTVTNGSAPVPKAFAVIDVGDISVTVSLPFGDGVMMKAGITHINGQEVLK